MLISFFKSSYLVQYGFLWLLALVLWSGSFINPLEMAEPANGYLTPGYALLYKWFSGYKSISLIIALLLVISSAFIFNSALVRSDLVPKNSLIPAFVLIITFSADPTNMYLQPSLIVSVFIIFTLIYIFSIYTREEAYEEIFYAAMLISIASFFHFHAIFILLFIFLTFIVYRIYFWREWTIVVLGFITPYILIGTYFFWINELHLAFSAYEAFFSNFMILQSAPGFPILGTLIMGLIVILFLFSFLSLVSNLNEKVISVRKRYWSVIWLLVISVLILLFSFEKYSTHKFLLWIPVSVFIAYKLSEIKKLFWFELYIGIIILLTLVNNLIFFL